MAIKRWEAGSMSNDSYAVARGQPLDVSGVVIPAYIIDAITSLIYPCQVVAWNDSIARFALEIQFVGRAPSGRTRTVGLAWRKGAFEITSNADGGYFGRTECTRVDDAPEKKYSTGAIQIS